MKTVHVIKKMAIALAIAAISFAGCEDDPVKVSGVSLDKPSLALDVGATETLAATVAPDDAENKAVTWESSNPDIATVVSTGLVTAIAPGSTTIVVTTADGNFTAECAVTVKAIVVPVSGVSLNKPTLTLTEGDSETLTATVAPDNATDKAVTWMSSNAGVATVDDEGKVTAVAPGEAVITVTTKDGGKTATCAVTVNEPAKTMTMTAAWRNVRIALGGTGTAVIDWGDGSDPEEVTFSGIYETDHTYSGASAHDITIDGRNITLLECFYSQLTGLDVSKNTALTYLSCGINQLTSLDVSNNTALTELYCNDNQLTNLDVSKHTVLTKLDCGDNQLTNLDVSKNTTLTYLGCGDNQLTNLDVSKHTALTYLECGGNQLTNLDVSKHTALTILDCGGNQLTSLDVSKNTALTYLDCSGNQLTSLDVSKHTALTYLDCGGNQLTSLDVSKHTALTYLSCFGNQLTSLDVSKNTVLTYLSCSGNQLTSLDVSKNTVLTYLDCHENQFAADGLNALFGTLHSNAGAKTIYISRNPAAGCDQSIATNKGWEVSMW